MLGDKRAAGREVLAFRRVTRAQSAQATALADRIERELRAVSRPERAEGERRYLKSELVHLGATVPAIRKVGTSVHREHPQMTHDELVAIVEGLWVRPVHERRMAAVELLDLGTDRLSAADAPLLERLLRESCTWALVDPLAVSVIGVVAERDPAPWDPIVPVGDRRRLLDSAHACSRTCLGSGASRATSTASGALADALLDEREFFVRKAIGWMLRETGKRQPELVTGWLLPRARRAAGLTVREAVKYLPEHDRERILAARS